MDNEVYMLDFFKPIQPRGNDSLTWTALEKLRRVRSPQRLSRYYILVFFINKEWL